MGNELVDVLIVHQMGNLCCFPKFKSRSKKRSNALVAKPPEPPIQYSGPPFPFLRLPREIRDEIYLLLLTRRMHSEIWIRCSPNSLSWRDATENCRCFGEN